MDHVAVLARRARGHLRVRDVGVRLARHVGEVTPRVERHAAAGTRDLDRLEHASLPERHDAHVVLAVAGRDGPVEAPVGRDRPAAGEVPEPHELARREQLAAALDDVRAGADRLVPRARYKRPGRRSEPEQDDRRGERHRPPAPLRPHEAADRTGRLGSSGEVAVNPGLGALGRGQPMARGLLAARTRTGEE